MLIKSYFEVFAFANRCKFRVADNDHDIRGWYDYDISYDDFIKRYGEYEIKRVNFEYSMFVGFGVFSVDISMPKFAKMFN